MCGFRLTLATLLIGMISIPVVAQHGRQRGEGPPPQAPRENVRQQQKPSQPQNDNNQGTRFRGPGRHAGDWLRKFGTLPPQDQQKQLESDPNFQKLPPERQQQLKQRLQNYSNLTPDQKERVLNGMEIIEHLSPAQRQQLQQAVGQFRQLDPSGRQRVKSAVRQMRDMTPEERQNFYNSSEFRNIYSPQEQNVIRSMGELGPPDSESRDEPQQR